MSARSSRSWPPATRRRTGAGRGNHLAHLRRAVERDRFGIVAHVLAVRDGCTPGRCSAFALLQDASRVKTNVAEALARGLVSAPRGSLGALCRSAAVAAHSPAVSSGKPRLPGRWPPAKPPSNLFFPSSSSIPPVNIMTAEPAAHPPASDRAGDRNHRASDTAAQAAARRRRASPRRQRRRPLGAAAAGAERPIVPTLLRISRWRAGTARRSAL